MNSLFIIAVQTLTHQSRFRLPVSQMEEIAAIPGVDMLFLGQNDLCMSMGLYEKYEFPHMYATDLILKLFRKPHRRRLTCPL
eukprot:COSAG02_NODE_6055_length_3838_cov_1.720246_2_plen_82_part_00